MILLLLLKLLLTSFVVCQSSEEAVENDEEMLMDSHPPTSYPGVDINSMPESERRMFGSKSLRCLVCKAVVHEFDMAVKSVDPDKKMEKTGSFMLDANGDRKVEKVPHNKLIPTTRTEAAITTLKTLITI